METKDDFTADDFIDRDIRVQVLNKNGSSDVLTGQLSKIVNENNTVS